MAGIPRVDTLESRIIILDRVLTLKIFKLKYKKYSKWVFFDEKTTLSISLTENSIISWLNYH